MLSAKFNRQFKLILCTCLTSYVQFMVGSAFMFSSIILGQLKNSTNPIYVDGEAASWIASVPLIVSPGGLLISGILTDIMGRRKALQIAYIPIITSWLILAFSNSYKSIIIGRLIFGFATGSSSSTYLYLAEICPTKYRALSFSVVTIFTSIGMLFVCVLAMFFYWHTTSIILFVMSVTGCVSLFLLPETPTWLRAQGRTREAENTEKWLGLESPPVTTVTVLGGHEVIVPQAVTTCKTSAIATCTTNDCSHEDKTSASTEEPIAYWRLYMHATVWKPALITTMFFICQQGSGFYVLLFYSMDVLRDFRVQWNGLTITVFMCLSRLVGSLAFSMLHHVKRKTLTVASGTGMAVSLVLIIAHMKIYKDMDNPPYFIVPIIAFIMYVFFALLAMLPLPWNICGEIFPMAVKGTMNGIVQMFGYGMMFLVIKIYPSTISKYGIEDVWTVFACFCVISALFGAYIMPETKGKSLNEILILFEPKKKSTTNILV